VVIQGVTNTGNAQNQTSLIQYGSEADDFEDVGSSIDVGSENSTTATSRSTRLSRLPAKSITTTAGNRSFAYQTRVRKEGRGYESLALFRIEPTSW
jgi:hypothetical protein